MADTSPRHFTTSLDSTSKIITTIAAVVFAALAFALQNALLVGLAAILLGISYAYSPREYVIGGRTVEVKRWMGTVRIPLDGIVEARRVTPEDLDGCIRLWGNGGLFGYTGLFQTSKLGRTTWYVTNRSNAVVMVTPGKTVLVSPDEVDEFLRAMPATGSAGQSLPEAPIAQRDWRLWMGIVAAALGAVAIAFATFAAGYAPGPPKYVLTAETLAIEDRYYPVTVAAAGADIPNIRIVDIAADPEWRTTERTNGFANSHYQSGWFRVASGKTVRMYRAGAKRLVLLPGSVPVLLEVAEPEKFIEEVRAKWQR